MLTTLNERAELPRSTIDGVHAPFVAFWRLQADSQNTWATLAISADPHIRAVGTTARGFDLGHLEMPAFYVVYAGDPTEETCPTARDIHHAVLSAKNAAGQTVAGAMEIAGLPNVGELAGYVPPIVVRMADKGNGPLSHPDDIEYFFAN